MQEMQNKTYNIMILSTVPDERLEMVLLECKRIGYRSIFCGDSFHADIEIPADVCHFADWNDTEALVRIAENEKADGIIGLCDKAMIPVAKTAQASGLPGNPVEGIDKLLSKNDFRVLQEKAGVFCPGHFMTDAKGADNADFGSLHFPVIVKPLLCSSSFGMTVIDEKDSLSAAILKASEYSRNGRVCVEEYYSNPSLRIIEIDCFVVDDDILWDGIRFCYRTKRAPLRPVYDVYPADLDEDQIEQIRSSISAVLKTAGISLGEYNAEGFFTQEGDFFIVEINPRQAGHYNPQDIELYCGVSLTRLLITTACNDMSYYEELKTFKRTRKNIMSYSVFSDREGVLDHIHIDETLKDKLRVHRYLHGQKPGDHVKDILNASRPVSKAVFEFETDFELEQAREHIEELVYAVLLG